MYSIYIYIYLYFYQCLAESLMTAFSQARPRGPDAETLFLGLTFSQIRTPRAALVSSKIFFTISRSIQKHTEATYYYGFKLSTNTSSKLK